MLKGAYTLSRARNETDDDGWTGLTWNGASQLHRNYALAGYDRPQVFQMAFLSDLPLQEFGQRRRRDDLRRLAGERHLQRLLRHALHGYGRRRGAQHAGQHADGESDRLLQCHRRTRRRRVLLRPVEASASPAAPCSATLAGTSSVAPAPGTWTYRSSGRSRWHKAGASTSGPRSSTCSTIQTGETRIPTSATRPSGAPTALGRAREMPAPVNGRSGSELRISSSRPERAVLLRRRRNGLPPTSFSSCILDRCRIPASAGAVSCWDRWRSRRPCRAPRRPSCRRRELSAGRTRSPHESTDRGSGPS